MCDIEQALGAAVPPEAYIYLGFRCLRPALIGRRIAIPKYSLKIVFPLGGLLYGNVIPGYPLRGPHAAEKSRYDHCGHFDSGFGDWREHHDLQRGEWTPAAALAGGQCRPAGCLWW